MILTSMEYAVAVLLVFSSVLTIFGVKRKMGLFLLSGAIFSSFGDYLRRMSISAHGWKTARDFRELAFFFLVMAILILLLGLASKPAPVKNTHIDED